MKTPKRRFFIVNICLSLYFQSFIDRNRKGYNYTKLETVAKTPRGLRSQSVFLFSDAQHVSQRARSPAKFSICYDMHFLITSKRLNLLLIRSTCGQYSSFFFYYSLHFCSLSMQNIGSRRTRRTRLASKRKNLR